MPVPTSHASNTMPLVTATLADAEQTDATVTILLVLTLTVRSRD
jgi:hypothetical protein